MNKIPIFDSLAHPTLDGNWILPKGKSSSQAGKLLDEMAQYQIEKALAVGLKGIGSYDENKFASFISGLSEKLLPIAYCSPCDFDNSHAIRDKMKDLKLMGYRGIKLHPRIGNFQLSNPILPGLIQEANSQNLSVLLCTYFYGPQPSAIFNNLTSLHSLLFSVQNSKLILLHGGGTRLLETIELARAFPNVLLDLSFTFLKYQGSSLDADIKYAFHQFDQRICIGSDFPEFSQKQLRERFDHLTCDLEKEKAENIAFKNLTNFLV